MPKRVAVLSLLLGGAAYHYFFEFIRTIFYDRALHMLNPYLEAITIERLLHWGPTLLLAGGGIWLFWHTGRRKLINDNSLLAPPDIAEHVPDLRVADHHSVLALFEGKERDKLFPLLEIEKLTAWARSMGPGEPPLTRLPGNIWKSHYLHCLPHSGPGTRAQTYLKSHGRSETHYYDLFLNEIQVRRIWPIEEISEAKSPFVQMKAVWKPSGGNDDYVMCLTIETEETINDVAVIARYAEAKHYIGKTAWEWSNSIRLLEASKLFAREVVEKELLRRPRKGSNTISFFGQKELEIRDDALFAIRVEAHRGTKILYIQQAYNVRTIGGIQLVDPIHLDDIAFVENWGPTK